MLNGKLLKNIHLIYAGFWFAFITTVSTSCLAGMINSKADWDGMPSNAKAGYVMAIYDMWFQDNFYDPDYIRNSKIDQETCLWGLGINTNNFIYWIDRGYLNPRNQELAPHNVFFQELDKVCK